MQEKKTNDNKQKAVECGGGLGGVSGVEGVGGVSRVGGARELLIQKR